MSKKTIRMRGGKDYALVAARLTAFLTAHPNATIVHDTSVRTHGHDIEVSATCEITLPDGRRVKASAFFLGPYAEKEAEKTETASLGRALALLGYPGDYEFDERIDPSAVDEGDDGVGWTPPPQRQTRMLPPRRTDSEYKPRTSHDQEPAPPPPITAPTRFDTEQDVADKETATEVESIIGAMQGLNLPIDGAGVDVLIAIMRKVLGEDLPDPFLKSAKELGGLTEFMHDNDARRDAARMVGIIQKQKKGRFVKAALANALAGVADA